MKTADERAKEWGEHIFETTPFDVVDGKACVFVEDRNITDVAEESYIAGAAEQKDIDINKACEIVRNIANKYCGDWEQSCKVEDTFRKAMEK